MANDSNDSRLNHSGNLMPNHQRDDAETFDACKLTLPVEELPPAGFDMRRIWQVAGLLLVLAVAAIAVDLPLARFCHKELIPGPIRELAAVAEVFGNGLSVAIILLAVWLLDPRGRIRIPRIATAVLLAGLGADLFKLVLGRSRPRSFDLAGGTIWETFGPLFPIDTIQSAGQGFPSAHTATGVAFAIALGWAYPRAKWLFIVLAVFVGLQRVDTCAHFLSDTLVGAAVGLVAGAHMLHPEACFGWTARVEAWLARKYGPQRAVADAPNTQRRAA